MSVQQETVSQNSTPHAELDVSKRTRPQKAVFHFISSMRMEKENHLQALCSSTSVKVEYLNLSLKRLLTKVL
jgi:hypothetical protein